MYSVLLVDDEYLELELLEKHISWEEMGFRVTETAKNGREALEAMQRIRPDVLITDVKMPFVDGITLAGQVYENYPETKIIFLSGYNQFNYLKAAFHVEAMDYLLKPVDFDELRSLMNIVKSKCDLGYQRELEDIKEIEQIMADPGERVYKCETMPDRGLLLQYMQANDTDQLNSWLNSFFTAAMKDNIYRCTYELLDYVYTVFVSPNKTLAKFMDAKPILFKKLTHIDSISLLKNVAQKQLLMLMSETAITEEADACLAIVQKVQRYVEAHYHEPFTIEALSESLNYSPNYIRSIFKKCTGETLLEYITNLRMERASLLLLDTTIRIRTISSRVGYSNPSYFCAQFFKKYGITPQQYRRRSNNEVINR